MEVHSLSNNHRIRMLGAGLMLTLVTLALLSSPLKAFAEKTTKADGSSIFHHWPH